MLKLERPLSETEIFDKLVELRPRALAPYSDYHVAAIAEIKINSHLYFYTFGVNIENDGHNRLSMHGEQAALANAITLFGGETKFSRLWIMAAPADARPDIAQKAGKACGHCRQILMSLAKRSAEIYSVTLDGRFSTPDRFDANFLPDAFSEQDLNLSAESIAEVESVFSVFEKLSIASNLTNHEVENILHTLSPHIIAESFRTSPVSASIIKCHHGRYAAGVLMQDVAFLTTDAIFSAIANAITLYGSKNLRFDEIHLASNRLDPKQFTLTEIEAIAEHYAHQETMVHVYAQGKHAAYRFQECLDASVERVQEKLKEKNVASLV